jgi:hypothetical protein
MIEAVFIPSFVSGYTIKNLIHSRKENCTSCLDTCTNRYQQNLAQLV